MQRRHTDFGVYARAAWAVRDSRDMYEVTDDGGLHYCYPPTFAVLMAPFAEPPGRSLDGNYLPFSVSVTAWCCLSILFTFVAAHVLASAVESTLKHPVDARAWWSLRIWPILLVLPALGNTLSHGQANTLLLLLIALAIAGLMSKQSRSAGAWLAGAIALKVIPAFLLLIPLFRRDRRCFAGLALVLVVLLLGIPALAIGPTAAWTANRRFVEVMINPAVNGANDADRSVEMFHVMKTDNQSIQAMLHYWQHLGNDQAPAEPSTPVRAAHWLIGFALTGITLVAGLRQSTGYRQLLFAGALICVMLFVSPMCHLHYYVLTMPLVTVLVFAARYDMDRAAVVRTYWLLGLHVVGGAIPLIFESHRNWGFAPLTTLPLWALAISELRRPVETPVELSGSIRKAA